MKHNAILNCICTFAIFMCIASEQVLETEQQDEIQVSTSSRKAVAYATPRDMRSRQRNLGSNDNLKALALQPCIDECDSLGFYCGNRINGEAGESSNNHLSCANGCELAYYSSNLYECAKYCTNGNTSECTYSNPLIDQPFEKCGSCQNGCSEEQTDGECFTGCELATNVPDFYGIKREMADEPFLDVPRFLFAGQSNMIGHSRQAMPTLFGKIVRVLSSSGTKEVHIKKLKKFLNRADGSNSEASANIAKLLFNMKQFLKSSKAYKPTRENSVCSFTDPSTSATIDDEKMVTPWACGGRDSHGGEFGPELMFAHKFPRKSGKFKRKQIGITKVAVGGTRIRQWMKDYDVDGDGTPNYWGDLVAGINAAAGTLEAFVWFQGENDAVNERNNIAVYADTYFADLTQFINDVRQEIYNAAEAGKFSSTETIPVIIVELGFWADGFDSGVVEAQRAFVESDTNARIVNTGARRPAAKQLSHFYHYDAASQLIIGNCIANALANFFR